LRRWKTRFVQNIPKYVVLLKTYHINHLEFIPSIKRRKKKMSLRTYSNNRYVISEKGKYKTSRSISIDNKKRLLSSELNSDTNFLSEADTSDEERHQEHYRNQPIKD